MDEKQGGVARCLFLSVIRGLPATVHKLQLLLQWDQCPGAWHNSILANILTVDVGDLISV